jgi:TRAP-type C4-dicarboxylate transport system permease small subunit
MIRRSIDAWPSHLGRVTLVLTWVGGGALLTMVAIIVVSVVMRYLLQQPMLGANELIQLASVVLVMSALPYCTQQEGHIRVDILDKALGHWGRLVGDVVYRSLSIFVLGTLTHRAVLKAADTFRWSDATNMLGLPLWPFYAVLAAGAFLCVLVFLTQLLLIVARRGSA